MDDNTNAAALSNEATRRRLFQRFDDLSIVAPTVPYPTHRTVEEGKVLRGAMAGTFTKNLLLKDKKGRLFLLTVMRTARLT